jgi:hypothetical protein
VVIAGGGTGGHRIRGLPWRASCWPPGSPTSRISFGRNGARIEARVVPREGFELDLIRS